MRVDPPTQVIAVDWTGAAQLLGVSPSHLFALRRRGAFGPRVVRFGRSCRILVDELRAWAAAGAPSAARWASIRGDL